MILVFSLEWISTKLILALFPFDLLRDRFEAPLEPLQMLTWLLLLVVVAGFYSFIVPGLPRTIAVVAGATYGILASSALVAGILACVNDPIDPNVRRFHEVSCKRDRMDDLAGNPRRIYRITHAIRYPRTHPGSTPGSPLPRRRLRQDQRKTKRSASFVSCTLTKVVDTAAIATSASTGLTIIVNGE